MVDKTRPWVGEVAAGRQVICTCAESDTMPFCDGAHARHGTGLRPCVHEFEEAKTCAICTCGKTGKAPFCDGSHAG